MDGNKKKKADKKIVILGDSGVGKTCLIRRYIEGDFNDTSPNTIGAAFFLKHWRSKNIAIWDTAGQEVFSGLTGFYCRLANAVILCYDICNRSSYDELLSRHSRLLETVASNCVIVFVGTKLDLVNKTVQGKYYSRATSIEEVMNISLEYTNHFSSLKHPKGILPIFETSSKTDTNVVDVFEYIFETLVPEEDTKPIPDALPSGVYTLDPQHSGSYQECRSRKCC